MVITQVPETVGQRAGCAVMCGFMVSLIGVPICGITAQELGLTPLWAITGTLAFGAVGAWIGFRR